MQYCCYETETESVLQDAWAVVTYSALCARVRVCACACACVCVCVSTEAGRQVAAESDTPVGCIL